MFSNSISKFFGKLSPGMCRLSTNGIAIKTGDGYKTYNVDTGNLVNCADFAFDVGDDMFFAIPATSVQKGDIILLNNKPVCVISVEDKTVTAFSYLDSTIINVVPQRHIFFGNQYYYTKIISVYGDFSKGVDFSKIMPFMMMSEITKGDTTDFGKMLPLMMMSGGFNFGGMLPFNFNNVNETEKETK